jgi:trans-2,3-dihydro-3-hydroxyanthranilate isomerase
MSSAKGLAYSIVDVFAEQPWAGNPLAVVRGAEGLTSAEMQKIARETNLSETTFVLSHAARDGAFDVRIFTPGIELPYAGHPTLGTASVIREELLGGADAPVTLRLGIGLVTVRFAADGLAWLSAPKATFAPGVSREDAAAVLSLSPAELHASLPIELATTGHQQLLVPLRDRDTLRRARIDHAAYAGLRERVFPDSIYAFCLDPLAARLFAPGAGVPEDPATGSAAGWLAAYLSRHRALGSAAVEATLEQGVEMGRPSRLHLRARDGQVEVGGRVIPVARGELL